MKFLFRFEFCFRASIPSGCCCSKFSRRDADSDDAASPYDVQPAPFRFGEDFIGFGSRIQPKCIAPFGGDGGKKLQENLRRNIDADHLQTNRNILNRFESGQSLDCFLMRMHGENLIALLQKSTDGFVAEFPPVSGRANDSNGFHDLL